MKKILLLLFVLSAAICQAQYVVSPAAKSTAPAIGYAAINPASKDIFKGKLYTTTNLMEVREEIGLTEAQVAKIKKLHAENSGQFSTLKWDLDDATSKMKKMLDQPKINATEVSQQLDEILRIENQMKRIQLTTMVAIKNELTPEQIEKLETPKSVIFGNRITNGQVWTIPGLASGSGDGRVVISGSPKVAVTVDGTREQPLYYIETKTGMKKVSSFDDIKPNDIESMSVFKGDQALEKFGKEAKNGAIVIRLKNMPE